MYADLVYHTRTFIDRIRRLSTLDYWFGSICLAGPPNLRTLYKNRWSLWRGTQRPPELMKILAATNDVCKDRPHAWNLMEVYLDTSFQFCKRGFIINLIKFGHYLLLNIQPYTVK